MSAGKNADPGASSHGVMLTRHRDIHGPSSASQRPFARVNSSDRGCLFEKWLTAEVAAADTALEDPVDSSHLEVVLGCS